MIHYHGLPMWPQSDMPRAFAARHGMVSFEHPEQIEIAAEVCQSVALDNGAFSAWKKKQPHDFAGYLAWCELWTQHPAVDWCVIPDVIDGTERENIDLIAKWRDETDIDHAYSVPVWHMHESLQFLEWLVVTSPRIALGSSGEYSDPGTPAWWVRMSEAMKVICCKDGMPQVKIHGLRMLDPLIFAQLPLSSADSCNVARNVGIDGKWNGPYAPVSKHMRALVMMDRIERHASARRWSGSATQHNLELLG